MNDSNVLSECQHNGTQVFQQAAKTLADDLYPAGAFRVEIADYGIEVNPDGEEGFWVEFRPLCSIKIPGPMDEKPNLRGNTRRQFFTAAGLNRSAFDLVLGLRDLCLPQPAANPGSTDVHGLIGRQIAAECEHELCDGVTFERWSFRRARHRYPQLGCTCSTCQQPHDYPVPGCTCSRCSPRKSRRRRSYEM